ncbi:hypothetical protein SBA3_710033 [Candidatus Sulfopaludibacter sp. SbA3]|nr:hypothetical protein SBA3_710033 [Candidatus Sulfopaludibacter sp. SbA3]
MPVGQLHAHKTGAPIQTGRPAKMSLEPREDQHPPGRQSEDRGRDSKVYTFAGVSLLLDQKVVSFQTFGVSPRKPPNGSGR